MTITAGTQLGPYEILAPLGAGGMGEVYRASDTRLKREVAIKVLPASFAHDADRLRRFEQEARAAGALNHPNILAIFDIGSHDNSPYVVSELLEGGTLRERISGAALTQRKAIDYALQIANGLAAAHEKGIVHRDLKPENLFITRDGRAKVLDFGLAKLTQSQHPGMAQTEAPTIPFDAETESGVILGTVGYMSPEQVRGERVDHRSDIFSFGAVLYEMLAGQRPFRRGTAAETMTAILREDPPQLGTAERPLPPALDRIVRRCLEKEPARRFQSALDLAFALDEVGSTTQPSGAAPARTSRVPWLVAAAFAVIAAIALWAPERATRQAPRPLLRLSVDLGPGAVASTMGTVAISPDGTRLVFPWRDADGKQMLATRLLDQPTATVLPGTEGGDQPFFSPDGQWIGFVTSTKLKKISVQGGAPVALADVSNARGATWGEDGSIIAALTNGSALVRIPAAGGPPQPVTEKEAGERTHRWPQSLLGGKAVLFTARTPTINSFENATIDVVSLETGQRKTLWRGGYFGRYLPTGERRGHLVYVHEGVLFGVPFDPDRLEIEGTPAPLIEDVASAPAHGGGQFDFSRAGTFVYLSGTSARYWPVVLLDSSGKTEPVVPKPGLYYSPRFSPDGQLLALAVDEGKGGDIFVYDLRLRTMRRLTFNAQMNMEPVWTPDGKHIVFHSTSPLASLWWVRADGAGEPQLLYESKSVGVQARSFSPDGRRLAYHGRSPGTGSDIWILPLDLSDPDHPKPGKPELLLGTPANEVNPAFSPDGRWLAYQSDESGNPEVYVRPFPELGGKWQISVGGGFIPIWSRNGRELFYRVEGQIMVAEYQAKGDSFLAGKPRLWSPTQILGPGYVNLDLAPDGKRFAVFPRPDTANEEKGPLHMTFLLNFFDEVRRRLPAGK